jgi:glycosyltransferase involved in cell wall biosynthesis
MREGFQNVRLLLVGAGSEMGRLISLVAKLRIDHCTEFVGEVDPAEVPNYMVAADVFALPSVSEGSPNVILEALAAGAAVVASRVGGVPDLVTDGREGLLVRAGDVEQMATVMGLILRDTQLRRKMSREARRRARSFPLNEIYLKTFQLCVSTLKNR